MVDIRLAESESDIRRCFSVMVQLRTHFTEADFSHAVTDQQKNGYLMAYLESDDVIRAVAGFRISRSLSWGRFMYVDDLVTDSDERSRGYGGQLFDWLVDYARRENCAEFHLDSGVQRFAAHRFYLRKGMDITCHHFALRLAK